jgi:4-hydroxybenzoate polyprenyltransferase
MRQPASRLALYLNLIRWDRPAGWLLLLWPTLSALWIASRGFPGWHLLLVFTLTTGAVTVPEALLLGAALAALAFGLVLTTNATTIAWSFVALAVTLAYPYAKRWVSMPQAVLGVAFSFGIPMAFSAVLGSQSLSLGAMAASVPPLAWLLLLGNLFWVLAYDTEYAMVDRDDDLRLGMKTSAITLGTRDVSAVMASYVVYLSIWALAPVQYGVGAIFYIAFIPALAQVLWHYRLIRGRSREGCFRAFRLNHWLGFTVFAGIAASYALA